LYGDTLVLAGLRASLADYPALEVVSLEEPAASVEILCALKPNVVIFDIGAAQPAFQYALIEKLPALLLLGIDPASNQVLAWSGHQLREMSIRDLVEIITRPDESRERRQ